MNEALAKLIEKHDASESPRVRAKVALIIYDKFRITKYLPDHGEHMDRVVYKSVGKSTD